MRRQAEGAQRGKRGGWLPGESLIKLLVGGLCGHSLVSRVGISLVRSSVSVLFSVLSRVLKTLICVLILARGEGTK